MSNSDIAWFPSAPVGHTAYSFKQRSANSSVNKKLPVKDKRNILITSALPYVNNVPHLGNIIGCVLSADVYSRFCRLRGHNSIYICGTDEYGTATERKALDAGMTPRQICDKYHAIHRDIYQWFDIEFDQFGRTTNEFQKDICQEIFWDNDKNDNILEDDLEQLRCNTCNTFLADRFVSGECPKCNYDDARGDQCDGCGQLMNPVELINPKCGICSNRPEVKSTKHLFLDLPKLEGKLQEFVTESEKLWTANSQSVTHTWLRDGLMKRCISRDLKWGTPIPKPGFTDKVFYVWFDAPIGYISITAEYTPHWRQWWFNPDNVELVQFMGKDNIPFHCVIFPSTLLGTAKDWTMLKRISTTEYLNYETGKFSKSRGTGVFGDHAQQTGIPASVWRYYLLANRPEVQDSVFTWDDLQSRNNNELLKNLGNFVSRSISFVGKFFEAKIPVFDEKTLTDSDRTFLTDVGAKIREYVDALEDAQIKLGAKHLMAASARGNLYLQDEQPWKSFKTDKSRCSTVVYLALCLTKLLGSLAKPYMPAVSASIFAQLNVAEPTEPLAGEVKSLSMPLDLPRDGSHAIGTPSLLFQELSSDMINQYKVQFGGQADAVQPPFAGKMIVGQIEKVEAHPAEARADSYVLQVRCAPDAKAAATSEAKTGEMSEKDLAIKAQGDIVRQLKTDKAPAEQIKAAVEALKALKGPAANTGKRGKKKEKVDVIEPIYQVVSPISSSYTIDELIGKKVVLLTNVKAVNVKQVKSAALLLLAYPEVKKGSPKSDEPVQMHLVTAPDEVPFGSSVLPQGYRCEPEKNFDWIGKIGKMNIKTNAAGQFVVGGGEAPLLATYDKDKTAPISADKFELGQAVKVQK